MKTYKEPEVRFVSLKPSEEIANKCWAYVNSDQSPVYYYDLQGPGSLEFCITKGNGGGCDSGMPTSVFYVIDTNQDGEISESERRGATSEEIEILKRAMHVTHEIGNGNSGENTSGTSFSEGYLPGYWS